jgi:hypothetical protein
MGVRGLSRLLRGRLFLDRSSDGSVVLSERETPSSVVEVEPDDQRGFSLINKSLSDSLFAMFKFEDRLYLSLQVGAGRSVREQLDEMGRRLKPPQNIVSGTEYLSKMSFCLGPPKNQRLDDFDGLAKIQSDDEPSCVVGPFQILAVPNKQEQ